MAESAKEIENELNRNPELKKVMMAALSLKDKSGLSEIIKKQQQRGQGDGKKV